MFCMKLQIPSDNANDPVRLPIKGSYMRAIVQETDQRGTNAYMHVLPLFSQCSCSGYLSALVYFGLVWERVTLCMHTLLGTSSSEDFLLFTQKPTEAQRLDRSPVVGKCALIEISPFTCLLYK